MMSFNERQVRQHYRILVHNDWTELRAIDPKGKEKPRISFVKNEDDFVNFCKQWNGQRNIYVGINARKEYGHGKAENIDCVKTIVIDIDAKRPDKKQAATDKELKEAEKVADKIIEDRKIRPQKYMSGNGYQLYFFIAPIKANKINEEKIEEFNHIIAREYSNDKVEIDNIGDLPRIIKVIGTMSVKGDDTKERPHRLSFSCNNFSRQEDENLREYILGIELPQKEVYITSDKIVDDKTIEV
ncbi:MAG: hypothetical protein KKB37_17270, partial [Alphaproteobacteria bacterium]|nr:hypothetical protein [Alphaproteobacteria bacterium]